MKSRIESRIALEEVLLLVREIGRLESLKYNITQRQRAIKAEIREKVQAMNDRSVEIDTFMYENQLGEFSEEFHKRETLELLTT